MLSIGMTSFRPETPAPSDDPLSSLADFSFGTAWATDEAVATQRSHGRTEGQSGSANRPRETRRFSDNRRGTPGRSDRRKEREVAREDPPAPVDFTVDFYPQDAAFAPMAEMMRRSGKTYEMFRVAQTFLAEPDRFVFVLKKSPEATTKFYGSPFDDLPFSNRDDLLDHLLRCHLDKVCSSETLEVERPTGNFTAIHRCPFTKRLIAAPNYHRHHHLLREHFFLHIRQMDFEKFCSKLETTRDPADIQLWLDEMARQKVYGPLEPGTGLVFHSLDEVRNYLAQNRTDLLRESAVMRVAGTSLELIQDSTIRETVLLALRRQRKFPLETVNAMRTKLKSAGLYVYKRGKKGVSFVCSVHRKFRDGQTRFSPSLQRLIDFIELNPFISVAFLCEKMADQFETKDAILSDLTWLIREGYVSEFENGTLLTYPPIPTKRTDVVQESAAGESQHSTPSDMAVHGAHIEVEESKIGGAPDAIESPTHEDTGGSTSTEKQEPAEGTSDEGQH